MHGQCEQKYPHFLIHKQNLIRSIPCTETSLSDSVLYCMHIIYRIPSVCPVVFGMPAIGVRQHCLLHYLIVRLELKKPLCYEDFLWKSIDCSIAVIPKQIHQARQHSAYDQHARFTTDTLLLLHCRYSHSGVNWTSCNSSDRNMLILVCVF